MVRAQGDQVCSRSETKAGRSACVVALGLAAKVDNDSLKRSITRWHAEKGETAAKATTSLCANEMEADADPGGSDEGFDEGRAQAQARGGRGEEGQGGTLKRRRLHDDQEDNDKEWEGGEEEDTLTLGPAESEVADGVPVRLRRHLMAECEAVSGGLSAPLPRPVSAATVLKRFCEHQERLCGHDEEEVAGLGMFAELVTKLFRGSLGAILLYPEEQGQLGAYLSRSGAQTEGGSELEHVYGSDHLLRLLVVLPVLMEPFPPPSAATGGRQRNQQEAQHKRFICHLAQLLAYLNEEATFAELLGSKP